MTQKNSAVPPGYTTVTPSMTFSDSLKAIEFYKKAFGAETVAVAPMPVGKGTMHAVIRIGNSLVMMGDEIPGGRCVSAEKTGYSPISLFIYVEDADTVFNRAVQAGAAPSMPMWDAFWGDRCGMVTDPFGYGWMIATHKKDLTDREIQDGARKFFEQMAQGGAGQK